MNLVRMRLGSRYQQVGSHSACRTSELLCTAADILLAILQRLLKIKALSGKKWHSDFMTDCKARKMKLWVGCIRGPPASL